jgi:hypothetical protein
MKTINILITALLMTAFVLPGMARKEEFKKTISKSYDVNKNATLELRNKFGMIQCENWDKNSIAIEVEITVEASSQEKANKYFDKIDVEISGSSERVTVETDFADNLFKNNNQEISVDFRISMPSSIQLDVDHKFGDLIIPEVEGNTTIELGYGSLKAKRLLGDDNEIDIKFSEGYIGYVKNLEIEHQYGEIEIDEAETISAESKFGSFQVGKVDVLTLESGYDDDVIGSVRDLDLEADFSEVEVRDLDEKLVAEIDYGELKVKEISSNFTIVDVSTSFAEANLGFHPDASFQLTATVKMGDFSYPRDRAQLTEVELSYTSSKYEGTIGGKGSSGSRVIVDTKNGGVNLFYR